MDDRFSRTPKAAGWTSGKRLPECRQCGKPPVHPRRTFCSDDCVHEWKIRTNPGYMADEVLKRDLGICALCGLDCVALEHELRALRRRELERHYATFRTLGDRELNHFGSRARCPQFHARCDEVGLSEKRRSDLSRRLWAADHIVPVVEGGGSCDLSNMRTLCHRCHDGETAKLRSRLSKARRQQADRTGATRTRKRKAR